MLEKLYDNVYRIIIPFEGIYTTSFVFVVKKDCIIADSGTNEHDARTYIIPEIKKMGLTPKYLVSSHTHSDHAGGMPTLSEHYHTAKAISIADGTLSDGDILLNRFKILSLKGHTDDSIGILDLHKAVLFSFDSLQGYGVGKYKTLVSDIDKYLKSIEAVRGLKVSKIIASHEYEPCGSISEHNEVNTFLCECENAVKAKT